MLNAFKHVLGQKSDVFGYLRKSPKFADTCMDDVLRPRAPSQTMFFMILDV